MVALARLLLTLKLEGGRTPRVMAFVNSVEAAEITAASVSRMSECLPLVALSSAPMVPASVPVTSNVVAVAVAESVCVCVCVCVHDP
jgi:hypothetical protein